MDTGSWHYTGGRDQAIPKKKKYKKAEQLSQKALQIAEKRREDNGKGERKDMPIWMQSSKE